MLFLYQKYFQLDVSKFEWGKPNGNFFTSFCFKLAILLPLFRLFNGIRTADICCQKRTLYQTVRRLPRH